jgi:hypothetical protein
MRMVGFWEAHDMYIYISSEHVLHIGDLLAQHSAALT